MGLTVGIEAWNAWAPGRSCHDDWRRWLSGEPTGDDGKPDLGFLAPLQRRRLSLLSRISLWLGHACTRQLSDPEEELRSVFASRYGEYDRAFEIMTGLAASEPPSPAAFSQSVHNTSSGLYSILTPSHAASTTVAAGPASLEAGFLEAALQAQAAPGRKILFIYDDLPLPAAYEDISALDSEPFGIGLLLNAAAPNRVSLSWAESAAGQSWSDAAMTDRGQSLVRFLMTEEATGLRFDDGRLSWHWRHGHA